jgi:cyclopropane fatty-acyl-phospholipid synthase-like methyltransferase
VDEERRKRWEASYGRELTEAELALEREVFGTAEGIWSYTTLEQADALAQELDLRPRRLVLDIGCGRGWPSVYLARTTGCSFVATDLPAGSPHLAARRAARNGVAARYASLRCSATHLPFRSRAFDAVIHTDVL